MPVVGLRASGVCSTATYGMHSSAIAAFLVTALLGSLQVIAPGLLTASKTYENHLCYTFNSFLRNIYAGNQQFFSK